MSEQESPIHTIPNDQTRPGARIDRTARETEHIDLSMHLYFGDQQSPHGTPEQFASVIAEVREMRGRVFYADGRRPFFRRQDGNFGDPDPADESAYHIIARYRGRAVGCARIVPPVNIQSGFIASTIGAERFEVIIGKLGSSLARTCEASRWVVLPEFRGRLGSRIVAASWAVARWLSFERAFVLACTCDKQDVLLVRHGARAIMGLPLFSSRISQDQFRLLYFDVLNPSEIMERTIAEMTTVLNLC